MEDGLTYFFEVDEAGQNEIKIITSSRINVYKVERDGVLFVIKDEKAKEAEAKVKKWLEKLKLKKEAP